MTFLEMARKTLEKANTPLTFDEIWTKGLDYGFAQQVKTVGKTPANTIAAQVYISIRDNEKSEFKLFSKRPSKFGLSTWGEEIPQCETVIEKIKKFTYKERDLHIVLAYFTYNYMKVMTKTINDKISKCGQKGKNEWVHPDMVGLDVSTIRDFSKGVLSFSRQINQTPVNVFSFEIKRKIEFSNLRESYFQAVSNSRWANKGYLVCAEIDLEDSELVDELTRLSNSYGIGLIKLDLENPDDSKILNEAHVNPSIEWDFVNYLFELNPDYKSFIEGSIDILKTEAIYRERFDAILKQEEMSEYIKIFKC